MPAVAKVNDDVQKAIGDLHDQRVVFADCGAAFLDAAGAVRERLMPDRLHPNAEGLGLLAGCIRSTLSYTFVQQEQPLDVALRARRVEDDVAGAVVDPTTLRTFRP